MAPITPNEVLTESVLQKAQAHQQAIAAQNMNRSSELHEYLNSLPDHHHPMKGDVRPIIGTSPKSSNES